MYSSFWTSLDIKIYQEVVVVSYYDSFSVWLLCDRSFTGNYYDTLASVLGSSTEKHHRVVNPSVSFSEEVLRKKRVWPCAGES